MPRLAHITALLLAAVVLAGCRDYHHWNQKLTLEVLTPGGMVTGSSVVQVEAWFGQLPMSGNEVSYEVTGEATMVEVAPGRYLFALLDGNTKERMYYATRGRFKDMLRGEWLFEIPKLKGKAQLYGDTMPMLVTFGDINLPQTVREVKPDELSKHFGPGVSLVSATLEITDEPVTTGRVEDVLGWLGEYYNKRLDGQRYGTIEAANRFANSLSSGAFRAGID